MNISKLQLYSVLLSWEKSYRAGETRTAEECLARTPEDVAKERTEFLWDALNGTVIAAYTGRLP